ncbi:MAG: hypothetical protein AMXMBFR33_71560 [Candidatus Xenobia bacterium]
MRKLLLVVLVSLLAGCGDDAAPIVVNPPPVVAPRVTGADALTPEQEALLPAALDPDLLQGRQGRVLALPPAAQVSLVPPVQDQGQVPSCMAFSFGYAAGTQAAARSSLNPVNPASSSDQASPAWLYKSALTIEKDSGCTGTYATSYFSTLMGQGAPALAAVPYPDPSQAESVVCRALEAINLSTPVTPVVFIGGYQQLKGTSDQQLRAQIKAQLASGASVAFTTLLVDGFYDFAGSGVFSGSNGPNRILPNTGHGMVIIGYDDTMTFTYPVTGKQGTGAFLIQNSWGTGWGNQGQAWIAYDTWYNGVNAYGGECFVMSPVSSEPVQSTGSVLTASSSAAPAGQISRAFQVSEDEDTTHLVLFPSFGAPLQLDSLELTSPGGVTVRQSFQDLLVRSGYLYFRRDEVAQFVAGVYQVTLRGRNGAEPVSYQGTILIEPLAGSALPQLDLDGLNEVGSTGQGLEVVP